MLHLNFKIKQALIKVTGSEDPVKSGLLLEKFDVKEAPDSTDLVSKGRLSENLQALFGANRSAVVRARL